MRVKRACIVQGDLCQRPFVPPHILLLFLPMLLMPIHVVLMLLILCLRL